MTRTTLASSAALEARLAAIEARLDVLEGDGPPPAKPVAARAGGGALWVLEGLARRLPAGIGAVVYAGRFNAGAAGELQWQISRGQQELLDEDWDALAPRLAALGHPLRLRLLQALLQGVQTAAELAARPGLASGGQLYHHLRELESAAWLHSPQRGSYALRPERVVPLMAMLAAARQ